MDKIIAGVARYQRDIFPDQKELFQHLREGQRPRALFITCSDSRIDPNLITQTRPGELFVLRNPGNMVPPFGAAVCGCEEATVEFAVAELKVPHIVVCGHYCCGAMSELVQPQHADDLPAMTAWLRFAAPVRDALTEHDLESKDMVSEAVQLNVLFQMANLQTHPSVADRLSQNGLTIHGWIYNFETAEIHMYDSSQHGFVSLV